MKVIGAGFGRTGTYSLKVALEMLGFGPCYHMVEVFQNPEHVATWQAAGDGQPVDWKALLDGYHAAVDWPACRFYADLMDVFPDAKVLLTVRDPEKWHTSVMNTIHPRNNDESDDPKSLAQRRMTTSVIWDGTFNGRLDEKDYAIGIYERHIEEVKQRVPADRLLVYQVSEGWEPLCRFLDVPVPTDTPFPRLNDTESFRQRFQSNVEETTQAS
ncbi:MAG: sulfotransferase family protein [Nitrolancea sp.]